MQVEDLYLPSKWSKRYSANKVVKKHIEFAVKASNGARKHIPCELNVPYGSETDEKYDIFGIDLPEDSPIFIYIHGGFWQELSREISSYIVEPLYKNKIKVIVLGYTLCPKATLNQITEQIKNAFLVCLKYAKDNKTKSLSVGGHSAGAHLSVFTFQSLFNTLSPSDQSLINGMFLISGIYDLTPLTYTSVNEALKLDISTARELSPLLQPSMNNYDNSSKVIFYVVLAENDSPAFIEQSKLLHENLIRSNYSSNLIIVKSTDHFDLVEKLNNNDYEITKLIIKSINA